MSLSNEINWYPFNQLSNNELSILNSENVINNCFDLNVLDQMIFHQFFPEDNNYNANLDPDLNFFLYMTKI